MRTRLILVMGLLLIGFALPALAQQQRQPAQQDETVVIKKNDLTVEQLAKVQQQEIKEKLGEYSEYAEMGRGIGLAVGESLKAVKDVAIDFSKSDVGKFTMFLIAWKIMAKDVIDMGDVIFGYLVGIPLLFMGGVVLLWSYRRQCVPRRVLVKSTKEGKEWQMFVPNEAETTVDGTKFLSRNVWALGHIVVGALFLMFCSLMIFGCQP